MIQWDRSTVGQELQLLPRNVPVAWATAAAESWIHLLPDLLC